MRFTTKAALTAVFAGLAGGVGGIVALAVTTGQAAAQAPAAHPGKAVYDKYCGSCHDNAADYNAPTYAALRTMSYQALQTSLVSGKMAAQGAVVPAPEMFQLLDHLAAKPPQDDKWVTGNMCAANTRAINLNGPETFVRPLVDYEGSRHMSARQAGLTNADLSNLEVAWTMAFPLTNSMRASPVIVGSTLFYSASMAGYVIALDTKSGCVKWAYDAGEPLRTSMSYGPLGPRGPKGMVFASLSGNVHAIRADNGKQVWKVDGRFDSGTMLTGGPILIGDKVILPVSSNDVQRAQNAQFECCKSQGAVMALAAADGKRLWTARTMEDAKPTGKKNSAGTALWGPSGAPIWATPTIDPRKGIIYAGTGENTSLPATKTSDAIWAIDLKDGKTKWFFQALENDAWNMSCNRGANCPPASESVLRDHDFGSHMVLGKTESGHTLILGGQKSGDVWAVNENGGKVWHRKYGNGSALGGVHWGMASDGKVLFVPIADRGAAGMYAIEIATGQELWQTRTNADAGGDLRLSAAPLSVDKAVIAATLTGRLVIFDSKDGKVIAVHDTNKTFPTLNGIEGKGGSIDAQSIAAGDGMVFVGSGYSTFGAPAGNVLIAYRPKK